MARGPGRGNRGATANAGGGRSSPVTTLNLRTFDSAIMSAQKRLAAATTEGAKTKARADLAKARSDRAAAKAASRNRRGGGGGAGGASPESKRSPSAKATGTGGKTPGPKGQRGGTPGRTSAAIGSHLGRKGTRTGMHSGATRGGRRGGRGGGGGGGSGGGSGGCFVEGTAIQMADGTTKEITTIQIGEETKGGTVQAKMEFMPQNIYEYKGVLVSGSHWVVEDNQFIEVQDSKHGVLTDRVEPVYTFKTSENRIWIHGIEFGDFETGSDEDWAPYFEQVKQKLNKELLLNSENI